MSAEYENMTTSELLAELSEVSGLPLSLKAGTGDDDPAMRTKLLNLLIACRSTLDRNAVLTRFLTGQISYDDFRRHFPHFATEEAGKLPLVLFVIAFREEADDTVESILTGLFPPPRNVLVRVDGRTAVLVREPEGETSEEALYEEATAMYETLQTEAMTTVTIAWDAPVTGPSRLPESFSRAVSVLRIGHLFSMEEPCIGYRSLGLNKLIARLPKEACEEYLAEQFPDFSFKDLPAETVNTINTLFDNGLNLAETARSLYVHRNTLVYRIEKFSRESGLDLRDFDDAVRCRMGMLLTKLLDGGE